MKSAILMGIVLVVLGGLALSNQGNNFSRVEKALNLGLIPAIEETQEPIPIPPIQLGIAMVGGVVLLVANSKRTIKQKDE
jgi:hypothetical protein